MQRLFLGVTVLSIALSLAGTLWRVGQRVEPEVLDRAAEQIRAAYGPGDVLILEPDYLIGMRERLGDLPLLSLRQWEMRDLVGYRRAHHVLTHSVATSFGGRYNLQSAAPEVLRQEWPGVSWVLFELPPDRSKRGPDVFRLREDVKDSVVTATYADAGASPCDRWTEDRWLCPRNSGWSWVGPTMESVGEEPRACVWLHPLKDGEPLTITFPPTPGARRLRGGFGFTDFGARHAQGPVLVRVLRGEQLVMERTYHPRAGWHPVARLIPNPVDEGTPLALEVSAGNNGAAHFCGDLVVEGGEP